jgi:hypothetical protein
VRSVLGTKQNGVHDGRPAFAGAAWDAVIRTQSSNAPHRAGC